VGSVVLTGTLDHGRKERSKAAWRSRCCASHCLFSSACISRKDNVCGLVVSGRTFQAVFSLGELDNSREVEASSNETGLIGFSLTFEKSQGGIRLSGLLTTSDLSVRVDIFVCSF